MVAPRRSRIAARPQRDNCYANARGLTLSVCRQLTVAISLHLPDKSLPKPRYPGNIRRRGIAARTPRRGAQLGWYSHG